MRRARREDHGHHDVLGIGLDIELDQCEREWLRMESVPFNSLGLRNLPEPVAIPNPCRQHRCVRGRTDKVIVIHRGPLFDEYEWGTVMVLVE